MAQTETATALRTALTSAQRRKIRGWRSDLGHVIWDLNESPLVHELRRLFEMGKKWPDDDMVAFSEGIEKVVLFALEIRKEMAKFLSQKRLSKQYKDRLEGALEGIWLGVGYLRNLMPDKLSDFIAEHLGDEFDLAQELFMGFCPISSETTRDLPQGARQAVLEEQVEQLYARERVAKMLDLKGMEQETQETRRKLQGQLKKGQTRDIHERGGCYLNGMKALRAAVMQMFYTLQSKDVRKIKLSSEDSENWHQWTRDIGEPPPTLVEQMNGIANDEGRTLHVFDKDNNLVYVAVPLWYSGEDPDSLAQRAALKQSKKARSQWHYDFRSATPSDMHEFSQSLDATQRRRVSEFLQRHPERSFSIYEVAELAGVPVHVPGAEIETAAAVQFEKNPGDLEGITDAMDEAARNQGLIQALWKMDLD